VFFNSFFHSNGLPVWKYKHTDYSVRSLLGQLAVSVSIKLQCSESCIFCNLSERIFIILCNHQECTDISKGLSVSSSGHLTESRDRQMLWNVDTLLPNLMVSHSQRQYYSQSPLREPQFWHKLRVWSFETLETH
jgi:hypothetical protein